MCKIAVKIWLAATVALVSPGHAQDVATRPKGWTRMTHIPLGGGSDWLSLTNNTSEAIRMEILDTNIYRLITTFNRLSDEEVGTVKLSQANGQVELYQTGDSDWAFNIVSQQLRYYARDRAAGHSKDFCMATLTNRTDLSSISDPFDRAFLKEQPRLPANRVTKLGSTTYTNKAGEIVSQTTTTTIVDGKEETTHFTEKPKQDEVGQRVSYLLVDGAIAWVYVADFKPNGSIGNVITTRRDAKEFDPKYSQLIKDVQDQVSLDMKKQGLRGFGSIHTFWGRVKEKLKNKGIDWHSPAELNPNANFD
jgi:hypothetical protein